MKSFQEVQQSLNFEINTIFPFSKQKVEELSEHFSDIIQFIVKEKGAGGRRLSCSRQQFTDLEFDELIAELTDYMHSDWYKSRQQQKPQKVIAR
jgi:hypothetical protein